MIRSVISFFIVIGISLIGMWSLFHPGLPPTHDGEYHVIRFYEFDKVLRSGVLYPRWAPDLNMGYGVPLFNFVYPLPNYVASFFHLLGFSFIDAFKLNLVFGTLVGAVGMYLWATIFWGKLGGITSSALYSFAPYRFVDVYVRGSVGEVWALAFAPFILWAITHAILKKDIRFLPIVTLGLALLIFSHNILALLFFGFSVLYSLVLLRITHDYKHLKKLILTFFLGLGVSAIFWLPALLEKQFVTGLEIFTVKSHFVELYQLLIPSWGSGFSGEVGQGLSPQIGIVNTVVLMLVILVLFRKRKSLKYKELLFFLIASFLILCMLMLPLSEMIWETLPLLNYFQFPWRLLSLVILIVSFLSGVLSAVRFRYYLSSIIIFFAVLSTYAYTIPAYYHKRDDNYYLRRPNFIYGTNSPGDVFNTVWFNKKNEPAGSKLLVEGNGKLDSVLINPTEYTAQVSSEKNATLFINTSYFPGWKVYFQDNQADLKPSEGGIMKIDLPKGTYSLRVVFTDTIIRSISSYLSLASICILLYMVNKTRYENRNR